MGMREQDFGRYCLNSLEGVGGRAPALGQRHEAFATAVQRQDGCDNRPISSRIKLHAMFLLSLNLRWNSEIQHPKAHIRHPALYEKNRIGSFGWWHVRRIPGWGVENAEPG